MIGLSDIRSILTIDNRSSLYYILSRFFPKKESKVQFAKERDPFKIPFFAPRSLLSKTQFVNEQVTVQ
jgi:hypothetical protein